MDGEMISKILSIILLDIVLSGDNAVVIALACRKLDPSQRKKAVLFGTAGAVVLRIVLTVIAVWILDIPFVKFVGGLLLLYIAWDLVKSGDEDPDIKGNSGLWAAVRTIIVADFVMSLDNVLAVAGVANGHVGLAALGLVISIPIIIFGSQVIMKLMEKLPILVWLGGLLIAYTSGEMLVSDKYGHKYLVEALFPQMDWIVPVFMMVVLIVLGLWGKMRQARRMTGQS